jgi:hypothetical protein
MSAGLEQTRREWEEGNRRFDEAARDPRGAQEALLAELDAVTAELRRRVGQTFTLAELAAAYRGAERWALEAVEAAATEARWPRRLAMVTDAAFHRYARGATDYRP